MFKSYFALLYLALVAALIFTAYVKFEGSNEQISNTRDVFFIWQDGKSLAEGENPYSRISGKGSKKNRKYTFYLPAFLIATAASIRAGFDDFQSWMRVWWPVSMLFHFGIGVVLFFMLMRGGSLLIAVFGSALWFFSRWPLALFKSGQIDAVPIFFLVTSLALISTRPRLSLISFGISLSFKQIAAILLPLYLLWIWQDQKDSLSTRELLIRAGCLLSVPLLVSLPFMIWDFESFMRMMVFPLTRAPRGPRAVSSFLELKGILSPLPLIFMLGSVYYLSFREKLSRAQALFLAIFALLGFSGVFFSRYVCWLVPLVPLLLVPAAAFQFRATKVSETAAKA